MDNFLRKIKLYDELRTELVISRAEFISAFEKNVEQSKPGLFSNSFSIFSSNKYRYSGSISYDVFAIKRRRDFNRNANGAKGTGTFTEQNGKLVIQTEISVSNRFIYLLSLLIFVYLMLIIVFLITGHRNNETFFVIPFILAHGVLMFTIFYFVFRRSISNLKYDLEREFYYWTKK